MSINFHGLGFIRGYSENLYTAKISTYTVLHAPYQEWIQVTTCDKI